MTVNDTDKFLVNRSNSSHQIEAQNLMAELLDDDLMLVNRDSVSYKATGKEIKDSLGGGGALPTIETAVLAEVAPDTPERFTDQSFTVTTNVDIKATEPVTYTYKAKVEGTLNRQLETDAITDVEFVPGANYSDNVTSSGDITIYTGKDLAFDGNIATGVRLQSNNNYANVIYTFSEPIECTTLRLHCRGGAQGAWSAFIYPSINGAEKTGKNIAWNSNAWLTDASWTGPITSIRLEHNRYGMEDPDSCYFDAMEVDGKILVNNQENTLLTFASDKDIEHFEQDDTVTMSGAVDTSLQITEVSSTTFNYAARMSQTNGGTVTNAAFAFDGDTSTTCVTNGDNAQYLQFYNSTLIPFNEKVEVYTGSSAQQRSRTYVAGGSNGSGEIAACLPPSYMWHTLYEGSGRLQYIKIARNGECGGSVSQAGIRGIRIDGVVLIDGAATVLTFADNTNFQYYNPGDEIQTGIFIISKDPDNNQMTITAGSGLAVGDSINSPNSPPPITGVVVETPTDTTMKLFPTSGTWETGRTAIGPTKTIQDTFLWCVFNGDGDIEKLQGSDPDYKEIAGGGTTNETRTLKFPPLLGQLETPDDTLPPGTSIKAYVKTQNDVGFGEEETNAVTPISNPGPNATMHGLRFDRSREPYLLSNSTNGAAQQFTFSAWIKVTGASSNKSIYTSGPDSTVSGYLRIYLNGINEVVIETNDGSAYTEYNTSGASFYIGSPQWFHLVVSVDTTQAALADQFKVYVNGTYFADTNSANATGQNASILQSPHLVGAMYTVDGSDANWMDGYLSDVFYVDGQTLDATAFGGDFEGKWGPLNSSVVKTNIGDFGTNGFFLPFDPAAQGVIYSNGTVSGGGTVNPGGSSSPQAMFDGGDQYWGVTGVGTLTYTLPVAVDGSTVTIRGGGGAQNGFVYLNGDSSGQLAFPGSIDTQVTFNNVSTLTSISQNMTSAAHGMGIQEVIVDGVSLIDHGSIGVDASGNDNHFHDQNFAVGDTGEVWSTGLKFAADAAGTPGEAVPDAVKGFDGALTTFAYEPSTEGLVWTPTGLSLSGDLEIYLLDTQIDVYVNGNLVFNADASNNQRWISLGTFDSIDSIFMKSSALVDAGLNAIMLNGKILVDGNIADTVLDTPMNSYAVLETGANGNLEATGANNVTYMGESGTDYYYEVDGNPAVHTGGAAFSSESGKVYNFGQQSFAGTGFESVSYSGAITGSVTVIRDGLDGAFDADYTTRLGITSAAGPTNYYTVNLGNTYSNAKLRVMINTGNLGDGKLTAGGVERTITYTSNVPYWEDFGTLASFDSIKMEIVGDTRNGLFMHAIEVNGKVLVASSFAGLDSYGNNLVQTWLEWNDVALLRSDSPEDVAKFNAIKAALEAYEPDCQQCKQNVMDAVQKVKDSNVLSATELESLEKLSAAAAGD